MISSALYLFIGIAVLMIVVTVVLIGPRLFTSPEIDSGVDRDEVNLAIYRDEMNRLTSAYSSGKLSEQEFEDAKTDLSRRFISEIVTQPRAFGTAAPSNMMRMVGFVVLGMIPVVAFATYLQLGSVHTLAMLADPDNDNVSTTSTDALIAHLRDNPDDPRAWVLLARRHMDANSFSEAAAAFEKAMKLSEKINNDPTVLCELAEAVGLSQGGTFRGRPRDLVMRALEIAPTHPMALEMAGSAAFEEEDYRRAIRYWKILRQQLDPQSRAYEEISNAIARVQAETGIFDEDAPPTQETVVPPLAASPISSATPPTSGPAQ